MPDRPWLPFRDDEAAAWRAQGFDVVTIPGFAINAMYGGALRCSVKVLERGS